MQKITRNSFQKGLNKDIDEQYIDPQYYTDAHNLTLVGDGKFLSLKDFKGTAPLGDVTGGITVNLASNVRSVAGKYTIGTNADVNCITYFITAKQAGDQGAFYITVYDIDHDVLYYLYQETGLGTDYFDEHRIVDARVFSENGFDYIYFSDGWSEIRQLRCEIPTGAGDYFLSAYDLSLQRRGANGAVNFAFVGSTGTLLSGTYQYAYRMVDPLRKRLTKWSSLTSPIHVYQSADMGTSPVHAAVGAFTPFAIVLGVTPTQEELDNFSYFQLAVIENIYPITSAVQPASLLPITAVTGTSTTFVHKSNEKIGLIPIEELVVDLSAIKTAKTLAIKQNRLQAGNVKYHNLQFDNGEPSITSGSVALQHGTQSDSFSNHNISSLYKGYFRDETYRFGIVYRDKYGNKSPVKTLDLSGITDNQISGAIDMHFPGRNVSSSYTLFNNVGFLQSLGLQLNGIHNHPTWAVGFEIVRAKRIKRILFQTPVIPMVTVTGVGAFDNYPSKASTNGTNPSTNTVDYPNAQPQTNLPVYAPKNLFWPEARHIRLKTLNTGSGATAGKIGEAELTTKNKDGSFIVEDFYYSMIFPPASMYGDAVPYNFGEFEKIQTVDYSIAKAFINSFATTNTSHGESDGDFLKTQISGTFASLSDGDYYFDSGWSAKTIDPKVTGLKSYAFQDNLAEGTSLSGNKILQYSQLSGTGVDWGFEPKIQRNAVIETTTAIGDLNTFAPLTFANGTLNNWDIFPGGGFIMDSSGPQYELAVQTTNNYINKYSGFSNGSSYTQAFRIVNVINDNAGDTRYGNVDAPHEFISTGASYFFTPPELVNVQSGVAVNKNITVFGGDCFVAANTFKVADSAYSVVNQKKNWGVPLADSAATLLQKWGGRFYLNSSSAGISQPVAVESASQFVQIILESEYNGGVMELDVIDGTNSVGDFPVSEVTAEGALRSPLAYKYNVNLSKQNDQKIYLTKQPFSYQQYNYKARINYSDPKIYNSDIQGFDVFRVGNTFDLEENKGALIKLALARDNVYAIQETGVVFLPTNQNQIQQTDAGILAVGTGDVIGRPIIIDQLRGGQHMNAIIETGAIIYIPDVINKNVYRLREQQPLESINELNVDTLFGTLFADNIDENLLIGIRDSVNKEFWLVDNQNNVCYVFSEKVSEGGTWMSNYEFFDPDNAASGKLVSGVFAKNNLRLISDKASGGRSKLDSHTMYAGDMHNAFGVTVTPRASFVINPEADIAKTFDDQAFVSDQRLDKADRVVSREIEAGDQVVTDQSLDSNQIEGNYRQKTLRDSASARLRGLRMKTTVYWKNGSTDSATLSSVLTKYRPSARTPF